MAASRTALAGFSDTFTPIDSCVMQSGEPIPRYTSPQYGFCSCVSSCNVDSCKCITTHGCAYNANGLLNDCYLNGKTVINPVIECSSFCSCNNDCINRVTQHGTIQSVYINNTDNKGYGVYASKELVKGSFVCEYIGQVIKIPEYNKRLIDIGSSVCYCIKIREHLGNNNILTTCIDASCYGNITRFINHSCEPNLVIVPIRSDSIVPRICLFCSVTVNVGEELSYRYCDTSPETKLGNVVCHCGSKECMGFLPLQV